jgi:type I restriction enzyme M protein
VLAIDLKRKVDVAWDRLWSGGVTNPLQCVEYLAVLLVILRDDDHLLGRLRTAMAAGDESTSAATLAEAGDRYGLAVGNGSGELWADLATLRSTVQVLESAVVEDRNADIVGDIFEHVLGRLSTAGQMGQFRTPRHLVQFLVAATMSSAGSTVLDPACGTGGFLIGAQEYAESNGHGLRLVGEEVDQTVSRLARANAVLHGMAPDTIRCRDSLAEIGDRADVILANPPFAGSIVADRVLPFRCGTRRTELLFLELIERRLRQDGRAGVVVPFGVLTAQNAAALWVRRRLLHGNRLDAVIELPRGVFRPYTDVKTALLFWRGGGETDTVLVAQARSDGYSLDDRREPVGQNDLPLLASLLAGQADVADHPDLAAVASLADIEANGYDLNPSRYLSHQHDTGQDEAGLSVKALVADLRTGLGSLTQTVRELEGLA